MSQPNPRLLDAVMARASTDPHFRRALVASPEAAVHQAFGVRFPEGFRARFREHDPSLDLDVVLPAPRDCGEELSDAELEEVAGGSGTGYDWADPNTPPPPPPPPGTPL